MKAKWCSYHLSQTVQNKLPKDLASFVDPRPKLLYEHIKAAYGANTGTRQAELWSGIWSTAVAENEDPEPKLAAIRSSTAEIVAATAALTVEQFADAVSAYAAIRSLPSSYGLLASTFISGTGTAPTLDDVIARVAAEHRRRETKGEVVNEYGLLAGKGQQGPQGGAKQGEGKWCEYHQVSSHRTADCYAATRNSSGGLLQKGRNSGSRPRSITRRRSRKRRGNGA